MTETVDLHCHWLPGIDDGPRDIEDSVAILRCLRAVGMTRVVATPHMRPGLYDNTRPQILAAFERTVPQLKRHSALPAVSVSSEHYFDELVYQRLVAGEGLPLPGGRAVLIEFAGSASPAGLDHRLADLRRCGLLPVIAHPERYQWLWDRPEVLERLIDDGAACVLNAAALVGGNGRRVQNCAEDFLDRGLYHATCSDAHEPEDVTAFADGLAHIESDFGPDEVEFLLRGGPARLLAGRLPE